jgi:predicted amidohydrolase YtcJ
MQAYKPRAPRRWSQERPGAARKDFPRNCIRAYTSGSAYAQFEEGKKGELKAGEYADFIVLSDDLSKIPPAQYTKTRVLQTVAGGRTVYESR